MPESDTHEPHEIRRSAAELLLAHLPAYSNSPWFRDDVCQGRLIRQGYSSGPDFCHWLLWELGCRDSRIINRDVPELNMKWISNGIRHLVEGSQRRNAWVTFMLDNVPNVGDIVYLGQDSRGEPEHLCVFMWAEGNDWVTADAGHVDLFGDQCVEILTRTLHGYHMQGRTGIKKQLNGWVDITQLDFQR